MLLLVQAAYSTAIGIVASGPLMGGLWLYLLKRARGEPAGIETAFSGFRIAFVDLFLAGFVTFLLTLLGFFCLILPGLYLAVVWMFALILVIDKRLDFWSAMELSRRMVTKHWFKVFGFFLVLLLMNLAGLLVCGIGVFFTAPIALAATVFAYEDIFGLARRKANEPSARVGPFGTAVVPRPTAKPAFAGGGPLKPVAVGLAVVVFFLGLVAMASIVKARKRHAAEAYVERAAEQRAAEQRVEASLALVFGPVVERVIEFTNASHRALNLASGNYVKSATDRPLDFSASGIDGLRGAGIDLFFSDAALNSIEGAAGADENVVPQLDADGRGRDLLQSLHELEGIFKFTGRQVRSEQSFQSRQHTLRRANGTESADQFDDRAAELTRERVVGDRFDALAETRGRLYCGGRNRGNVNRRHVLEKRRVIWRIESVDVVVAEYLDEISDHVFVWRLDLRRDIQHAERLKEIERVIRQLLD